jgi:hypothetical protein
MERSMPVIMQLMGDLQPEIKDDGRTEVDGSQKSSGALLSAR